MNDTNMTRISAAVPRSGSRKTRTKVIRVKIMGRGNPWNWLALGGVDLEKEWESSRTKLILANSDGWKEKAPT